MSWLDDLLFGIKTVVFGGSALPQRPAIEFAGPAVLVTDDAANARTAVTINASSFPFLIPIIGTAGVQTTSNAGFTVIGELAFDPSAFGIPSGELVRSLVFRAILAVDNAGATAELRLYNLDTGSYVSAAALSTTSTTPARLVSSSLGVPGDLPNALTTYQIHLRKTGGNPGDRAICTSARLDVIYA